MRGEFEFEFKGVHYRWTPLHGFMRAVYEGGHFARWVVVTWRNKSARDELFKQLGVGPDGIASKGGQTDPHGEGEGR